MARILFLQRSQNIRSLLLPSRATDRPTESATGSADAIVGPRPPRRQARPKARRSIETSTERLRFSVSIEGLQPSSPEHPRRANLGRQERLRTAATALASPGPNRMRSDVAGRARIRHACACCENSKLVVGDQAGPTEASSSLASK